MLDPRDYFTFIPSLIWVPFGKRDAEDITFPLASDVRAARHHASSTRPPSASTSTGRRSSPTTARSPTTGSWSPPGRDWRSRRSPGSGPSRATPSRSATSTTPCKTREAWQRFLENPGPVVVGTAQGGSCFGASYEFLLNTRHQLKKAGLAGSPGHLHHRRAVPRPFRPRRRRRLGEARREVLRQARHPRHPEHHHRRGPRRRDASWEAAGCCRSDSR